MSFQQAMYRAGMTLTDSNESSKIFVEALASVSHFDGHLGYSGLVDSKFVASTPYRIAALSASMFISFSVLNLMQYPLTLALPSSFLYVWAKYFLSLMPRI